MEIRFYSKTDKWCVFSNFSWFPIYLENTIWKTNEHFYQAMKYYGINPARMEYINNLDLPAKAKKAGNMKTIPIRPDWDLVKDDVMRLCCLRKVQTHRFVYDVLQETGNSTLIEDSESDYYWGSGADNTGKNMLGKIWMEIRDILKNHDFSYLIPEKTTETNFLKLIDGSKRVSYQSLMQGVDEMKKCSKSL